MFKELGNLIYIFDTNPLLFFTKKYTVINNLFSILKQLYEIRNRTQHEFRETCQLYFQTYATYCENVILFFFIS